MTDYKNTIIKALEQEMGAPLRLFLEDAMLWDQIPPSPNWASLIDDCIAHFQESWNLTVPVEKAMDAIESLLAPYPRATLTPPSQTIGSPYIRKLAAAIAVAREPILVYTLYSALTLETFPLSPDREAIMLRSAAYTWAERFESAAISDALLVIKARLDSQL